jgi:hypothetical protein
MKTRGWNILAVFSPHSKFEKSLAATVLKQAVTIPSHPDWS